MVRPADVTIGTTSRVVRLPGSPPTLCLSMTGVRPHSSRSPVATIASVRSIISWRSSPSPPQAVRNEASSMSE